MSSKTLSLRKKKDFERVFLNSKKKSSSLFLLRFCENKEGFLRVGIIISKKVSKLAVKRNKLRRQIKYYFQKRDKQLKSGYDLILTVSPRIIDKEYKQIEKDLDYVFKSSKLFR